MWFNRRQYDRLSSFESDAGIDEKDSVQLQTQSIVTLKNVAAVSGWALSFVLIFLLGYQDDKLAKQSNCFEQTSAYSPIIHDVPQDYILTRTNGTLDFPSKFRGPPSPELDRTWDEISIFRPLSVDVSDEEYRKFGSSIETAVRNEAKYGGNFFVQPEFSHHLHCVNLLRKASYFNFEYYRTKTFDFRDTPEPMIKTHIDHCLEMLRQFVMCNADVGLVASHWVDGIDHPWPDFNTNKKCRDFKGILEWTLEHQAPEGIPQIPKRPDGVKGLATPP